MISLTGAPQIAKQAAVFFTGKQYPKTLTVFTSKASSLLIIFMLYYHKVTEVILKEKYYAKHRMSFIRIKRF